MITRRGICAPGSPGTRLASAEVTRGLRGVQQACWMRGDVAQVHGPGGGLEDERPRLQQGRVGVEIVRRVERALGDRHVPGRADEQAELGDGDRVVVHPEPVHLHPARGALLGVELVRPHQEAAPGHPRHILGRRPASGSGPGR